MCNLLFIDGMAAKENMHTLAEKNRLLREEVQIRERFEMTKRHEDFAALPEFVSRAKKVGLSGVWKVTTALAVKEYIEAMNALAHDVHATKWEKNEKAPNLEIDCSQLIISGDLVLESLKLPRIDFRGSRFWGEVFLAKIIFTGPILFSGCIFRRKLFMNSLIFGNRSDFSCMQLLDAAYFRSISFPYPDEVSFSETQFQKKVEFSDIDAKTSLNFKLMEFDDEAKFDNSQFSLVDFTNTKFSQAISFEKDEFNGAPLFHGAEMQEGTTFSGCRFKPSHGLGGWTNRDYVGFRTLKLKMASFRAQREEAYFYALELRAGRTSLLEPSSLMKYVISLIYDVGSEYGQSPGRAISIFFIWNGLFYLIYRLLNYWSEIFKFKTILGRPEANALLAQYPEFSLVLQSAFNPLALFSDKAIAAPESFPILILSLCQSIGSLGLLALFLLAIRGNFQRGGSA